MPKPLKMSKVPGAAKELLKKAKPRKGKYKYRDGTMTVRCSPKKLNTEAEMALCALLANHTTIKEIARLMGCSQPVVSRAIRAFHYGYE